MKKFTLTILVLFLLFSAQAQNFSSGDGTTANPYGISSKAELLEVSNFSDNAFVLLNDVDFENEELASSVIGNFSGKFDGMGYRISNLTLEGSISFFGTISGTVKNLHIRNVGYTQKYYSNGTANANNQNHAPFVHTNNGEVENCSYSGTTISAYNRPAGFVLNNNGLIKNCYSDADVSSYDGMNASGNWFFGRYPAGFVSSNNSGGIIENCYSSGVITAQDFTAGGFAYQNSGEIKNSFAFNPSVTSTVAVYRFAGSNSGLLSNVYALETMTLNGITISNDDAGSQNGADISPVNTQITDTYTNLGWDFEKNWFFDSEFTYPQLRVLPDCPVITLSEITASICENSDFNETISASGGDGNYTFEVTAGSLPEGMSLSADGVLSGTPSESGESTFTVSATDENECTGIREYTMTIEPIYNETQETSICYGETFLFGTQSLTEPGEYTEVFESVSGCDSTVVLTLTVNPVYDVFYSQEIIDYIVNDDFEDYEPGALPDGWIIRNNGTGNANQRVVDNPVKNGTRAFQLSGAGWASNLQKNISDLPEETTIEGWMQLSTTSCGIALGNPSIGTWGAFLGRVETENGNFITYNHSGSSGPKYILQPVIPDVWYHIKIEYNFPELKYKVYIDDIQVTGTYGSESLNEFSLLDITPTSVELSANGLAFYDDIRLYDSKKTGTVAICESDVPFIFGNLELTESGTYTETFQTIHGCDSVVTLNLIVNPVYNHTDEQTICENDTYQFGTQSLTEPGEYTETFSSVSGCDSTVVLTLTVNPVYNEFVEVTIHESKIPYIFGDEELTESDVYIKTFPTIAGCDSTVNLTLNIVDYAQPVAVCNPFSVTVSKNESYTFTADDIAEIASGSYDFVTAFDNLEISVTPDNFTYEDAHTDITVMVVVTNEFDLSDTCYTTVTVLPLSMTLEDCRDITIYLDENGEAVLQPELFYSHIEDLAEINTMRNLFTCSDAGYNYVTVNLFNSFGERYSCLNILAVFDTIPPKFEPVTDIEILLPAGTGKTTIDYPEITANDNCAVTEMFLLSGFGPDGEFSVGEHIERWVAADASGNADTLEFSVTVRETPPEPNNPPFVVLQLEDIEMFAGETAELYFNPEKGVIFDDLDEDDSLQLSLKMADDTYLPEWIVFRNDSLLASPPAETQECADLVLVASDNEGETALNPFTLCVIIPVKADLIKNGNITIYPNPTTGKVYLDFVSSAENRKYDISVLNLLGQKIINTQLYGTGIKEIDISNNVAGIYIIRITDEGTEVLNHKLILNNH